MIIGVPGFGLVDRDGSLDATREIRRDGLCSAQETRSLTDYLLGAAGCELSHHRTCRRRLPRLMPGSQAARRWRPARSQPLPCLAHLAPVFEEGHHRPQNRTARRCTEDHGAPLGDSHARTAGAQ